MRVAFIIPCLNEQSSVARVVRDCRQHMPEADVYVLDNNSSDETAVEAARAGAKVIHSPLRGKGHVIRHAFRVIDADYYVMIDGDGTYPVEETKRLLDIANSQNYEMVMGSRLEKAKAKAFRPLHFVGNKGLTGLVRLLFNFPVHDLLTGFRIFSRRFASEVHLLSHGFELETELTIRAMAQDMAFCEVPISYGERDERGQSKLRTFRDGFKILRTILRLWRNFRPLQFFSSLALLTVPVWWLAPALAQFFFGGLGLGFLLLGFYLESQVDWIKLRRQPSRQLENHHQETFKKSA